MSRALEEARKAFEKGEVPVGAVLVRNGEVLASSGNQTRINHDPTQHAEMLVIQQACKKLQSERLFECDLYVTLEPCAMCAAAISFARIRRLYFAASDPKGGAVEHGPRFFDQPTCHHKPDIYSSINESESSFLLKDFFQSKR